MRSEQPDLGVTVFCPGPTTTEFLQVAFTGEKGVVYGGEAKQTARRMTAERCGYLMAVAIANRTHMNYVGAFPVPLLLSVALYFPNLKKL